MSRPITRLVPELMPVPALYRAARDLSRRLRWESDLSPHHREKCLNELDCVLNELELRGTQLELPFDPDPPAA
jgi:hypothetical protein